MRLNKLSTSNPGFTLIELLLAMTFLAGILIFSTVTIVQALGIFNKGVAFKQINQAGRQLTSDLSQVANGGFGSISSDKTDNTGFICIYDGSTYRGYFWDTPGTKAGTGAGIFTVNGKPFSIVKTNPGVNADEWCQLPPSSDTDIPANSITNIATDQVGVVASDIISPDQNVNPGIARLSFTIGTVGNTDASPVFLNGIWQCQGGNLGNFCAVGTFETVLYSPNGSQ